MSVCTCVGFCRPLPPVLHLPCRPSPSLSEPLGETQTWPLQAWLTRGLEWEFLMVVHLAYWQGFGNQSSPCSLVLKASLVQEQALL